MVEMESFMSACVGNSSFRFSYFFSSFPFLAQEMDRLNFHNSLPLTSKVGMEWSAKRVTELSYPALLERSFFAYRSTQIFEIVWFVHLSIF
jgi:hypothetical protein